MIAVPLAISSAHAEAACSPDLFKVEKFRISVVDGCTSTPCPTLKITGVLRSSCKQPAGVQLKITAYDSDGAVVDTQEFWPASVSNIGAGGKYPFNAGPLFTYSPDMKAFDWEVIGVRQW